MIFFKNSLLSNRFHNTIKMCILICICHNYRALFLLKVDAEKSLSSIVKREEAIFFNDLLFYFF